MRQHLGFLNRNLKNIDKILDENPTALTILKKQEYKYLLVIKELYRQQEEMFTQKKNSTAHRIVSIHQPHIRPMVRGKQGRNVEFGAKINVSLQNGYARIDQLDFESFNEGIYLKEQVENYKTLHGHYPELVQTDDIYMNRENRNYLKENGIRHTGRPLGRKQKTELRRSQKKVARTEKNERNHIEGKFGQGKSKYNLNKIMARLENTAQSWISVIFFVMNILKLSKALFCSILKPVIINIFAWEFTAKKHRIQIWLQNSIFRKNKALLRLIRLFLQTRIGVESTNEIPVESPRQHVFKNKVMGKTAYCISSVKRL